MFIHDRIHAIGNYSLNQLAQVVSRKVLSRGPLESFSDEHPCVFVLSTGRAGTKTLSAVLGLAPSLFAVHEPRPKLFSLSRDAYRYSYIPETMPVLRTAFRTAREELLEMALWLRKGYVETSPQVTFLARVIAEEVPAIRFIHLVRAPASVVSSGIRRGWYCGHKNDPSRIEPVPGDPERERWGNLDVCQKNAWLWAETNRWIADLLASRPELPSLLVRSEDLFAGRQETLAALFNLVGAPSPSGAKVGRVLGKKLNADKRSETVGGGPLTPEQLAAARALAGDVAARLGYEL